jgi:hypothetical protein
MHSLSIYASGEFPAGKFPFLLSPTLHGMSLVVSGSPPLSEAVGATDGSETPTLTRQAGTLVKSEEWWRDHYYDIERHGYKLRSRYHPRWEPSWVESRRDFYSVEDGQALIVRFNYHISFIFLSKRIEDESRDGCCARTR